VDTKNRWIIGDMPSKLTNMKYLSAIRIAKIGLAILLLAALNFSIAKADAHVFEASEAVFEKVIFATDTGDLDLATHDQRFSENGEAFHGFDDCHIHIIGPKQAQLACDQSSADRSRHWADASVVLATLQGFYRPPRG